MKVVHDSVVIGGGLSGLATANALGAQDRDVVVLEARAQLGGRIQSQPIGNNDTHRFDMGPAWVWPHNQRIISLAEGFGLSIFPQYAQGNLVFEEAPGRIRRDIAFSAMGDALRIAGGIQSVVEALALNLNASSFQLNHRVSRISKTDDGVFKVEGDNENGVFTYQAKIVILAVPPRVIADTVEVSGAQAKDLRSLASIPTWMAGHAKFVAHYEKPFWRDRGLSGDAISRVGPLMEIHDASPMDGETGALFGFVGTPADHRQVLGENLSKHALEQLTRLFGEEAAHPVGHALKDWAFDPETATEADWEPPMQHPTYGYPREWRECADQGLILASTETAPVNGGFLEGALEAAENAISRASAFLNALEPSIAGS